MQGPQAREGKAGQSYGIGGSVIVGQRGTCGPDGRGRARRPVRYAGVSGAHLQAVLAASESGRFAGHDGAPVYPPAPPRGRQHEALNKPVASCPGRTAHADVKQRMSGLSRSSSHAGVAPVSSQLIYQMAHLAVLQGNHTRAVSPQQ